MGAPEHQRVGVPGEHPVEHGSEGGVSARRVGVAVLHDLDEVGCGLAEHEHAWVGLLDSVDVLAARSRSLGAEHGHPPASSRRRSRLSTGCDHTDDRNIEPLPGDVQGGRRRRVAGDHDQLGVHGDQHGDDVEGECAHLALRSRPIREMRQVGDVEEPFRG
ncbi:MAG: hypothetical protein QOE18_677 [Chloroflexota bacterium]|nr:hypothetical protein [Chloroflexota bacterium]